MNEIEHECRVAWCDASVAYWNDRTRELIEALVADVDSCLEVLTRGLGR